MDCAQNPNVRADMTFFKTPGGECGILRGLHRLAGLPAAQRL